MLVLEFTYLHWFTKLEQVPTNVALEDVLNLLYEVELASFMSDFDENLTSEERESHTEILTASLQNKVLYLQFCSYNCSFL